MIHIEHGRWDEAATAARRARVLLGDATSFPGTVLALALSVLVETHAGRDAEVDADRQLCHQHLTGLVDAAPWLNLQARVALTRDALIRGRPRPGGGVARRGRGDRSAHCPARSAWVRNSLRSRRR